MLSVFTKLFDSNDKEVNKLLPTVSQINSLEEKFKKLKDSDFSKKTEEFKKRIKEGESLEDILPEAFALVREAAHRAINQRHFDVQLIAAITLASGKIAEQKTGEGKTLSAVPALYLHALTGKGVHLVTVNDYLARRDAGWMGPVFSLLGVTVSSIINDQSFIYDESYKDNNASDFRLLHLKPVSRKEAYLSDVTYGINSEFGFDYLRDNMAQSLDQMVQRGYYYAIVDEVDSVLIDEARTPHIISAPDESPTEKYYEYAKVIDKLSPEDYQIDEKLRTAHLTDQGLSKIEKMFNVTNIYEKDFNTVYHLEAALKARTLFQKEKDYIVKDEEVILVDEFTGRLMIGRRLSEGIHQAIEAKENVPIQKESKTLATVSLQNYFRMYERLSGMTGTAVTEAQEFHKIYGLDVVVIPTNKPLSRIDEGDAIYKTGEAKINAVIKEIEEAHKKGQPILVGTTSIDKNQVISNALNKRGIKHQVLNAKNHEKEAEIIAKAGEKGAITVATNMAGRGVDIVLGGETPKSEDGAEKVNSVEHKKWRVNHDDVLKSGGLYVIGTERHESRRIDNQLRGRSGRQGDPGRSKFFVSLDDEIMRIFGGDTISGIMTRFNMPEDMPLEHPLVSRAIEQAQSKVEGFNFDQRKALVEYDDVINKQREIIYKRRKLALEASEKSDEIREEILSKIKENIASVVMINSGLPFEDSATKEQKIVQEFSTIIPFDPNSQKQLESQLEQAPDSEQQIEFLQKIATDLYEKREKDVGRAMMKEIEKFSTLSTIDSLWTDHLDIIDNLRQGVQLRAYGQRDPLVEYKNEAYSLFENLINAVDDGIVHSIFKIQVASEVAPHVHVHTNTPTSEISATQKVQTSNSNTKIGRNDPCWCGSGKKWKKCHFPVTG